MDYNHLRVPFGLQLHGGSLFEHHESITSKKSRKHKLKKNKTVKK